MRDDRSRLQDITEAADLIRLFTQGRTLDDLRKDRLLESALLHQLTVIGEAARRVSDEIKEKYPDVPWKIVQGFRNHIAQEYFALDLNIVWQTVTADVPRLREQIDTVIQKEFH